jgi:hypothetical protein
MENQTLYLHCTNAELARMMSLVDPFARAHSDLDAELAGWESDFEMARR